MNDPMSEGDCAIVAALLTLAAAVSNMHIKHVVGNYRSIVKDLWPTEPVPKDKAF